MQDEVTVLNLITVPLKESGTVQMFGNILNKSQYCSEIN